MSKPVCDEQCLFCYGKEVNPSFLLFPYCSLETGDNRKVYQQNCDYPDKYHGRSDPVYIARFTSHIEGKGGTISYAAVCPHAGGE